jgi:hypothetical protein
MSKIHVSYLFSEEFWLTKRIKIERVRIQLSGRELAHQA